MGLTVEFEFAFVQTFFVAFDAPAKIKLLCYIHCSWVCFNFGRMPDCVDSEVHQGVGPQSPLITDFTASGMYNAFHISFWCRGDNGFQISVLSLSPYVNESLTQKTLFKMYERIVPTT